MEKHLIRMANNFITNNKDKQKTLKGRIKNLFILARNVSATLR